jgi:hypothetical protein
LLASLVNYTFSAILSARLVASMPIRRTCRFMLSSAQFQPGNQIKNTFVDR